MHQFDCFLLICVRTDVFPLPGFLIWMSGGSERRQLSVKPASCSLLFSADPETLKRKLTFSADVITCPRCLWSMVCVHICIYFFCQLTLKQVISGGISPQTFRCDSCWPHCTSVWVKMICVSLVVCKVYIYIFNWTSCHKWTSGDVDATSRITTTSTLLIGFREVNLVIQRSVVTAVVGPHP